ncbi:MAG: hypothetical protein JO218_15605 [Burkholderiales bacterium]|nr:hypothetical protein [Burkholderiales bacterium]
MEQIEQVLLGDNGTSFTGAEVLMMMGESIRRDGLSAEDQDLALRAVEQVIADCRMVGYARAEILETMLIRGATRERCLTLCREAVAHMGSDALLAALWRASGEVRH